MSFPPFCFLICCCHQHPPTNNTPSPHTQVRIFTPSGDEGLFDFCIISTGLLTDARLRPELSAVAHHIATWGDKLQSLPDGMSRNALIDAHPYLGPSFEFLEKVGVLGHKPQFKLAWG